MEITTINRAIRTGDEQAWKAVVDHFYGQLKRYLEIRYRIEPEEAEQFVQEAFLKLSGLENPPEFSYPGQFYNYLKVTGRSVFLDHEKSIDQQAQNLFEVLDEREFFAMEVKEDAPDMYPKITAAVKQVLGEMPEKDRKILEMRANQTEFEIISREVGINSHSLRTYYTRAKAKFKKRFEEITGTEGGAQ